MFRKAKMCLYIISVKFKIFIKIELQKISKIVLKKFAFFSSGIFLTEILLCSMVLKVSTEQRIFNT